MPRPRAAVPAPLARAAGRFERWRAHRTTRRIPEELWALATELGVRHGVSRTSRALHVQYDDLKKRVLRAPPRDCEETALSPAFVEIRTAPTRVDQGSACRVEFEKVSGEKMRVEWNGAHDADLAQLARLFLERAR